MPAGRYRNFVTIQKPVAAPGRNALGEVARTSEATWETHCTAWVSIEARGSREFNKRGITQDEVSAVMLLRHSTDAASVLGTYRVKHGNKIYALSGPLIDPTGKRAELQGELIG